MEVKGKEVGKRGERSRKRRERSEGGEKDELEGKMSRDYPSRLKEWGGGKKRREWGRKERMGKKGESGEEGREWGRKERD